MPAYCLTKFPQDSPLAHLKSNNKDVTRVVSVDEVRLAQLISVEKLEAPLRGMHKDVLQRLKKKRAAAISRHNRKTGVREINFDEGNFVLRGLLQQERGKKTALLWKGPYRVTACRSEFIFEFEDLLTRKKRDVHGRCLKFFRNKDFNVTEPVLNHLAYQENELLIIDSFEDIRRNNG